MKHFYKGCAGVVLMLALSVPVFAGQMPCGDIDPPPPPQTAMATTEGDSEMSAGVVDVVVTLLLSVL
jgi:hypothetical protein